MRRHPTSLKDISLRVPYRALLGLILGACLVVPSSAEESPAAVVVEGVKPGFAADKAGLKEGDTLTSWDSGSSNGRIASPFDLGRLQIEIATRGTTRIEGKRGDEKREWTLGPGDWGLSTRPSFSDEILSAYQHCRQIDKSDQDGGSACWLDINNNTRIARRSWLPSWLLLHRAESLADAHLWKLADVIYPISVKAAESADPEVLAQIFQSWANMFNRRSDYENAERYYQLSLEQGQKIAPETLFVATTLNNLGIVVRNLGDLAKSEEYHERALGIARKLAPESLVVSRSLKNLGLVADHRGDSAGSEARYLEALAIEEKLAPGSLQVAGSLNNLGSVARTRGELEKSESYYRRALEIRENIARESLEVAASFNNLGEVALDRGDLDKSYEYHRHALSIREKLAPGTLDVAGSLLNLGNVAYRRGDLTACENHDRQALTILEKIAPNSLNTAAVINDLGSVEFDRGNIPKAEQYYRQALAIKEKQAPLSRETASTLDNLGVILRLGGQLTEAERCHRKALEIVEKISRESLDTAGSFNLLAAIEQERGNFAKAKTLYERANAILGKIAPAGILAADTLFGLGEVNTHDGRWSKAAEYYRDALAIRERLAPGSTVHAETLAALASLEVRRQNVQSAGQLYQQALNALENQVMRLGGASDIRSGFRANHDRYYKEFIDLLVRENRPERAFEVLERSRARTMLEILSTGHIKLQRGVAPELLDKKRSLEEALSVKSSYRIRLQTSAHDNEQLAAANQDIKALLAQIEDIEDRIRATSPSYSALSRLRILSAKQIQRQLLDANTILLEYSLGAKRSYLWIVSSNSLTIHRLPKRSTIESLARRVYDDLNAQNRTLKGETVGQQEERWASASAEYPKVASELAKIVLGPASAQLVRTGTRLLIVSDGALQYIPFGALPIAGRAAMGSIIKPLVVEHEIVNLPSISVLAELRRERKSRTPALHSVAVLADPVFDSKDVRVKGRPESTKENNGTSRSAGEAESDAESEVLNESFTRSVNDVGLETRGRTFLPRLELSRKEAEAIVAAVPSHSGTVALDFQANRTLATSEQLHEYRIIHFATHGLLDNDHPELSGLVLSMVDEKGRAQNGFLELQDIYNLNLPVDLVVLSACETGLGKEISGEGLVGLTRGFMYAGALRVVASLWKIDDEATANLMGRFYEAMERDGMRPAAALRRAQVEMWNQKQWKDPYFWAAFQIQGDWQ